MPELTPMKRQYQEIKQQYNDCLLFFRLAPPCAACPTTAPRPISRA